MAKTIVVVAVLAEAGLSGFATQIDRVTEPIEFNGGTASLHGRWKYHLGDDATWASPVFDDSSWEGVLGDKPWGAPRRRGTYGLSWYRVHIKPGVSAPQELAVLFPPVEDAYEVYWNGRFVGSYGKLPPWPSWYHNGWTETFGLGRTGEGVLAVRVWKSPSLYFAQGEEVHFQPVLGGPEAVAQAKAAVDFAWLQRRQYVFGTDSLIALIFVIGVIGWLRDRKQWALLWMALFAFVPCAAMLLWVLKTIRDPLATGIFQLVGAAAFISTNLLMLWLLDLKEDPRLVRTAWFLAVAYVVASMLRAFCFLGLTLPNPGPAMIGSAVLGSFSFAVELFPLYLIMLALKRRQRFDHSRWMVAVSSSLVFMITTFSGIITIIGQFFERDLSGVIWRPIAVVWGNPIQPLFAAFPICLLTVFYAVYRYSSTNRRKQIALEEELRSAREIQSTLIPETLPSIPGIELTSAYRPVLEVGGDFFQVLPLKEGSTLIVLGDVSGKGLKAAMAVLLIVGILSVLVETTSKPAELLAALNRSILGKLQGGFATCVVLRLDSDGSCVFVNAGHPAPFLNGREFSGLGALPVGIAADAEYAEARFELAPGDHLALYSDGLLEARNAAGDLYGFERLEALLSSKPDAAEAAKVGAAFGQDDDITVLTLTRLLVAAPQPAHLIASV